MGDADFLAVLIIANMFLDIFLAGVVIYMGRQRHRALLYGQMLLVKKGEFADADRRSQGGADAGTTDDGPA